MKPEFSEFTFGFSITKELVNAFGSGLTAAPILPSLIQESKVGYDLELDCRGIPILIQFKLSEYMRTRNAKEYKLCQSKQLSFSLNIPFYKMKLMKKSKSNQHDLLFQMASESIPVYYTAPAFYKFQELNNLFLTSTVYKKSVWISPIQIGTINDNKEHSVVFTSASGLAYRFSEPRRIKGEIDSSNISHSLHGFFTKDRNLEENEYSLRHQMLSFSRVAIEAIKEINPNYLDSEDINNIEGWLHRSYGELMQFYDGYRGLSQDNFGQFLYQLAMLSAEIFGCQLFIVTEQR